MQLDHTKRICVLFEFYKNQTKGNIEDFAKTAGISSEIVLHALSRKTEYIDFFTRLAICIKLDITAFIWSTPYQTEKKMLYSLKNQVKF